MIHAASSMNVVDMRTGRRLLGMRFQGLAAALEYLARARLVCSDCGKTFNSRSTVTMMNRSDTWEVMFPHDCQTLSDTSQDSSQQTTAPLPSQL